MHSLIVIAGFFLMILAPCAFAIFSSGDQLLAKDQLAGRERPGSRSRVLTPGRIFKPGQSIGQPAVSSWRATPASSAADYDLLHTGDAPLARANSGLRAAQHAARGFSPQMRAASNLLAAAANAEADSIAAQVYAAQANKAALTAAARAASARAAAATALAADAERAVAEAARLAAAVRRAYETAPASIGPEKHALPETHPSMDFPRSHVIRRAA